MYLYGYVYPRRLHKSYTGISLSNVSNSRGASTYWIEKIHDCLSPFLSEQDINLLDRHTIVGITERSKRSGQILRKNCKLVLFFIKKS